MQCSVNLSVYNMVNQVYSLVVEGVSCDQVIYSLFQAFGRTPLTNISPKKTLEGALAGLAGCVLTTVLLSTVFRWPRSLLRCEFWNFYYYSRKVLPSTSRAKQKGKLYYVLIRFWT
jgi:CDP-diglyceride synthetase